jgi:hypothetical protein
MCEPCTAVLALVEALWENQKESGMERKPMQRKWLGLAPWQNKQGGSDGNDDRIGSGEYGRGNLHAGLASQTNNSPAGSADQALENFEIELLPVEDVCLSSERVRELSKEMKRAAVLMALDTASTPIQQVQQDAKARLSALDSYEVDRKKQLDAEWARKAEKLSRFKPNWSA